MTDVSLLLYFIIYDYIFFYFGTCQVKKFEKKVIFYKKNFPEKGGYVL